MAVTHADLAIDLTIARSRTSLETKLATCLMFFCTILGLLAFVFGIVAETSRTEAIWISVEMEDRDPEDNVMKCVYSSDGWHPLVYALGSMLSLVVAMGICHAFICISLCRAAANYQLRTSAARTPSDPSYYKTFRWRASVAFVLSWVSFAVAAVLLSVGIVVEVVHRQGWSVARDKCMVVRVGVFAGAGVVGLFATSMSVALYMSTEQDERMLEEEAEANVSREVMEITTNYAPHSPASSSSSSLRQQLPARDLEK